ncbi:MAG: NAD(P)-binding protein [Bacteroidia bacterium]
MKRRDFLLSGLGLGIVLSSQNSCKKGNSFQVKFVDDNSERGHLLREPKFENPKEIIHENILIIGAGISGLSAGRRLKKSGINDFKILELAKESGGNSISGKNTISNYPWAAHYLPIPDERDTELITFLKECNVITGINHENKLEYNEQFLCFDPEERLYINGHWQEGLVPHSGIEENDHKEIKSFFELIQFYKNAKGKDGKDAFCIPLKNSSNDSEFTKLDEIDFYSFMLSKGYRSKYLFWYLDYCCRDDFGSSMQDSSAWAGIHYFASRKGKAANAESGDVLTWPEGNAFLANGLKSTIKEHLICSQLVYSIEEKNELIEVLVYDFDKKESINYQCKHIILSGPQYINKRILKQSKKDELYNKFTYSPWMVANISLHQLYNNKGIPLCWDNVIYGSQSLGYVNACQQHLNMHENEKVITYYYPLSKGQPKQERELAYKRTEEDWKKIILADLKIAHPNIEESIKEIEIKLWGHGMIRPIPGLIKGDEIKEMRKPLNHRIYFANSDITGISIFEEAFHSGLDAADLCIENLNKNA